MTTINAINSSFPFSVANGGTGLTTLTAHGILVGEGTSAVNPIVLTNGELLIGSTGANPVAAAITSTASTLTITNGAGSINIDITAPVNVAHGGTGATSFAVDTVLVGNGTTNIGTVGLSNGELVIGSAGATPVGATLTAGTGISITNGAGSITIAATGSGGGGFMWMDVTGTSQTLVAGSGYIADNAALVTFTLPATAAIGDTFILVGKGAGGWTLLENTGQTINFGTATTTATTGSLSSTNNTDSITFVCTTVNTGFTVFNSIGNITYV